MLKKLRLLPILSVLLACAILFSACSVRAPQPVPEEPVVQSDPVVSEPEPEEVEEPQEPTQEDPEQEQNPEEEAPSEAAPVTVEPTPEIAPAAAGEDVPHEPEDFDNAPVTISEDEKELRAQLEKTEAKLAIAAKEISSLAATSPTPAFDLTIPQTFKITRPTQKLSTTYASYYITGTSNPSQPVYIDGQEIERQGTKGTFGAYVTLDMGANTFTFSQGGESTTVTITRVAAAGTQPISAITQGSMWPAVQGGVKAGGNLRVECVAPSGATVTASFGGRTVTLQQVANATQGIPATFRGEIAIGDDYSADVTTKVGKVSYELRYNGQSTQYKSSGDVFVAGKNSYIAIRVTAYQGFVYPDTNNLSVFREKLKTGATDYVYAENNTYYQLYSGGWVPKEQCEIIEGQVKIGNRVSGVTPYIMEKRETFSFAGIQTTAYHTEYNNGIFKLTLYNTNGTPNLNVSGSRLFSAVTATANDNSSVTYTFTLKNTALYWGYQVWYDGTNTVLRFRYKPTINSSSSQPLKGVTVMLDPGHGNQDSGALGVAGLTGPDENTLNLANAYAIRDELVSQGAAVVFTRYGLKDYLTLDQRLQAFEVSDADIFISVHHNSLAESTNADTVRGTEVYYHTPHTANVAKTILDSFTQVTGRRNRGAKQSYYRVTLLPQAPSMLIELGFICNPLEYEESCSQAVINKNAKGIAEGLKKALA